MQPTVDNFVLRFSFLGHLSASRLWRGSSSFIFCLRSRSLVILFFCINTACFSVFFWHKVKFASRSQNICKLYIVNVLLGAMGRHDHVWLYCGWSLPTCDRLFLGKIGENSSLIFWNRIGSVVTQVLFNCLHQIVNWSGCARQNRGKGPIVLIVQDIERI